MVTSKNKIHIIRLVKMELRPASTGFTKFVLIIFIHFYNNNNCFITQINKHTNTYALRAITI